jgi:two-component system sensor histidine kinase YesM
MIISIVFLVIFIGVTFLIAFKTTRSIKKLGTAMKKFGEGDLDVEIEITGSDEIVELTQRFNKMVKQIEYLIGKLKENERQKTQIYYESLIAQINPHFLYNTLNSIKWAASLSNAPNVVSLIISLGALLEASTSRGGDIVTLEQEIEYVKHYMNLQYARYGERICIHFDIPIEANNLLIPKFIIQPIVENAIIHAFDQFEIKGDIYIQVVLHRTFLLLLIKDNGKGISYERTMEILGSNNIEPNNSTMRMGIGISSVHKRIQIMYGTDYGLIFSTEIDVGTTFRLKLPLSYKQDN